MARAIHDLGSTPNGPFVAVNCGALPRELAESELFGHERGAFTGAAGRRQGWFEEANGGTLVLDEIGELPMDLQPKLLRVLETGRIRRVGGAGEFSVSVRVVAATLRDLRREAAQGGFRADLYHRLAGFELELPPLRRRRSDILVLAQHFLREMEGETGPRTMDADAAALLEAHDWPGNVRELRNVIHRAAILTSTRIDAASLELDGGSCELRLAETPAPLPDIHPPVPCYFRDEPLPEPTEQPPPIEIAPTRATEDTISLAGCTFADVERLVIAWAMRRSGGSRRKAARSLEMSRSTLCDKVKRYGLA